MGWRLIFHRANLHTGKLLPTVKGVTTTSRRELNKQATRAALVQAAIDLSREIGADELTVDMVAERVGVSRRTFHNYFPSLELCLVDTFSEAIDRAVEAFAARPRQEPVVVSAGHAFTEVFGVQLTSNLVTVMQLVCTSTRLVGTHHEQWHLATERLVTTLRERVPEADQVWISALAASLMGVAESVLYGWVAHDPDLTEEGLATLKECFLRGLTYLGEGFNNPPPGVS